MAGYLRGKHSMQRQNQRRPGFVVSRCEELHNPWTMAAHSTSFIPDPRAARGVKLSRIMPPMITSTDSRMSQRFL